MCNTSRTTEMVSSQVLSQCGDMHNADVLSLVLSPQCGDMHNADVSSQVLSPQCGDMHNADLVITGSLSSVWRCAQCRSCHHRFSLISVEMCTMQIVSSQVLSPQCGHMHNADCVITGSRLCHHRFLIVSSQVLSPQSGDMLFQCLWCVPVCNSDNVGIDVRHKVFDMRRLFIVHTKSIHGLCVARLQVLFPYCGGTVQASVYV